MLLVSGSLRARSTNSAALRTAYESVPAGVDAVLYDGLASLPHFNPDDDVDPLPPAVARLRAEIRDAGALLFSTPEYAGSLPGSFKNLLDWCIGDDQPGSIYEKPVGWINVSPRSATQAYETLRVVLGYAHAHIIEAACATVPVTNADVDASGVIPGAALRERLAAVTAALAVGAVTGSS